MQFVIARHLSLRETGGRNQSMELLLPGINASSGRFY